MSRYRFPVFSTWQIITIQNEKLNFRVMISGSLKSLGIVIVIRIFENFLVTLSGSVTDQDPGGFVLKSLSGFGSVFDTPIRIQQVKLSYKNPLLKQILNDIHHIFAHEKTRLGKSHVTVPLNRKMNKSSKRMSYLRRMWFKRCCKLSATELFLFNNQTSAGKRSNRHNVAKQKIYGNS